MLKQPPNIALCKAAYRGDETCFRYLYNEDDKINIEEAVAQAVVYNQPNIVTIAYEEMKVQCLPTIMKLALAVGNKVIAIKCHDKWGYNHVHTIAMAVLARGKKDMVQLCCSWGWEYIDELLEATVRCNNALVLEWVLQLVKYRDIGRLFYMAITYGHQSLCTFFTKKYRCCNFSNALKMACRCGDLNVVRLICLSTKISNSQICKAIALRCR